MNTFLDLNLTGALVVAHDAGGAEILSALVKRYTHIDWGTHLAGPAITIFERKLPQLKNLSESEALNFAAKYKTLITGTSWASDLEKRFIKLAHDNRWFCVTFLDHWTDYISRFSFEGKTVLPNEIWVGDEYAKQIAEQSFPDVKIRFIQNPFFLEIKETISYKLKNKTDNLVQGLRILYVCEPRIEVSQKKFGHPNYYGYTEFQALTGYLEYIVKSQLSPKMIVIRRHPSENPGKYDHIIHLFKNLPIQESPNQDLLDDIIEADWVVGCDSMALVIALLAGKKVFSCIPSGGKPMTLPFPEIIKLF